MVQKESRGRVHAETSRELVFSFHAEPLLSNVTLTDPFTLGPGLILEI